jgi:hypothetical protein
LYPDSAYDPIASPESPFQGEFYVDGNVTTLSSISASGNVYASNATFGEDVTIQGNLTVLGDTTEVNTFVYITSALDISNVGTGPALRVAQSGSQPIAHFIDNNGDDIIFADNGDVGLGTMSPNEKLTVIGNVSATGNLIVRGNTYLSGNSITEDDLIVKGSVYLSGNSIIEDNLQVDNDTLFVDSSTNKVGIRTTTPYKTFTVNGEISANNIIFDPNGDSNQWNSTYSSVKTTSATWDSVYSSTKNTSANWDSVYSSVKSTSANWDSVYSSVKSTSANWNSVYSSTANTSANWNSVYSSVKSTSANWDSVYSNVKSNSASYATIDFTNNKFFALSGGRIDGNVTIFGDLTSTGTQTFANTIFSTTSSLSVVHIGAGPAIWVGNNGTGDIASFNDIDQGIEMLHVGGVNSTYPNVGVKTSTPNKTFTVKGEISASSTIWDSEGNSNQWNSVYSSTKNVSANWNSVYSNVQSGSANWSNMFPTSGGTVSGNITINGTITAPNASSVLSDQVANVGTLDTRYYNAIVPQLTERQYFNPNGKWVQVAEFPAVGQRHHIEFTAFVSSDFGAFSSFKLFFIIDGYDNSGTSNNFFPVSQIATDYGLLSAIRMRTPNISGPKPMFLDLNLVPSTSGTECYTDSYAKIYSRNTTYVQVVPNLSAIVDPVITSQILGPEFFPGNGALFKPTTGDYSGGREGQTVINNEDNNIKIFAEGAWRQIASW